MYNTNKKGDKKAMYKTTTDLWSYLVNVKALNTSYNSGAFGQKIGNKFYYDCVCLIKSFPWCNAKAGGTPIYKDNDIADDWIGGLYQKATNKSYDMSKLPTDKISLVYVDNSHIGVYNPTTKTVIECCAGNTNRVVERDFHYYDNTSYEWNKWSNLYWCEDVKATSPKSSSDVTGYIDEVTVNHISGWVYDKSGENPTELTIQIAQHGKVITQKFVRANQLARPDIVALGYPMNVGYDINIADLLINMDGECEVKVQTVSGNYLISSGCSTIINVVNNTTYVPKAGDKFKLGNIRRYESETTRTYSTLATGYYWLHDNDVKNNRVKITNRADRVDVPGQVTCWIDKTELTKERKCN